MNQKVNRKIGIIMTLIGGSLWGFSGNCGQFLFNNKEMTANWLVPMRLLSAGTLVLLLLAFKKGKHVFDVFESPRGRRDAILFGLCGMQLCQYTYFKTIEYSNAGIATMLQYTGPAMILVFICLRDRRKPKGYEILALCCSMAGTVAMATHGDLTGLSIPMLALIWGLISAVTQIIYTLQPAWIIKNYSALDAMGWGMLIGGISLSILIKPWNEHPVVDAQTLMFFGIIVIFGTIISFYCYLTGVRLVGAASASVLACIEPVAAMLINVVWLKVKFQMMDLLGLVLILSTVFIISLNQMKEEKQNELKGENS